MKSVNNLQNYLRKALDDYRRRYLSEVVGGVEVVRIISFFAEVFQSNGTLARLSVGNDMDLLHYI